MTPPTDIDFTLRLLLAVGCGLAIGIERQWRSRTAGLRTNALVAAGACAFVLFGEQAGGDRAPLQITAYVVSGVGFLGGGVILRQGFSVQGLNTAATLWCSAAVGCQAAGGHLIPSVVTTAVILAIHLLLRPLGRLIERAPHGGGDDIGTYSLTVDVRRKHEPHLRAQLLQALADTGIRLQGLNSHASDDGATVTLRADLLIDGNDSARLDGLVTRLSIEPGVRTVAWKDHDPDTGDSDLNDDIGSPHQRWSPIRLGTRESAPRAPGDR